MSESRENIRIPEKVERQTSVWLLRRDRGLTAAEQDDFLQWLAADRLHGECLAAQQRDWERMNLLAEWRPGHSARPNRDLLAPSTRRPVWLFPTIALGAAATIALGVFLAWPRPATRIANPQVETAIAAIRQHVFEDGSIAELNRGAEIEVSYTAGERRVRLARGEAYFTVAKNPGRPFIVNVRGVEVRAIGTAFNVRVDAVEVEVLVKEGRVKVASQDPDNRSLAPAENDPATVSAGERVLVSLTLSASPLRAAAITADEMERRLAWQPKMLDFTGASLAEIVEEFNRRNVPFKLVVADPALRDLQLSATLRSDNVEGLIRFLESGFGVRAERAGTMVELRKASVTIQRE